MSAQQCRRFLASHFETCNTMLAGMMFGGWEISGDGMREYGLTGTIAYGEGA